MLHLIIGGEAQGKLDYALKSSGSAKEDVGFCQNNDNSLDKKIIYNLHLLVEKLLKGGMEPIEYILQRIDQKDKIIICNEIGCGVVPVDPFQRQLRETTGRLCYLLAQKADKVERIFCGIPLTIKNNFHVCLIRHGKTEGNHLHQYTGRIDEPLSPEGIKELENMVGQNLYPKADEVFVSPMKRCFETKEIIFPGVAYQVVDGLKEMNFGEYDGLTFTEINRIPGNEEWGMTEDSMIFPKGETIENFKQRCKDAFINIISTLDKKGSRVCQVVCHGGVIMSIMDGFAQESLGFHQWRVDNGCGYEINFDLVSKMASVTRSLSLQSVAAYACNKGE